MPGDHLFVPSADAELILAIAEILERNSKVPKIHLRLIYDDVGCHPSDPTWRSALKRLSEATSAHENVVLLAETRAFATAMQEIWHRPVDLLPHPSELSFSPAPTETNPFVVYVPGQVRSDKGLNFVEAVVKALSAKLETAERCVRLRLQGESVAAATFVSIECLPSYLSAAEYRAIWQEAHMALLLHDPRIYRLRGSGVVCDAVAIGRPFVCLVGSSLGEWSFGNSALYSEPDPDSIAEAIVQLMTKYDRFANVGPASAARFAGLLQEGIARLVADRPS